MCHCAAWGILVNYMLDLSKGSCFPPPPMSTAQSLVRPWPQNPGQAWLIESLGRDSLFPLISHVCSPLLLSIMD